MALIGGDRRTLKLDERAGHGGQECVSPCSKPTR
jgi:hypothetical protein